MMAAAGRPSRVEHGAAVQCFDAVDDSESRFCVSESGASNAATHRDNLQLRCFRRRTRSNLAFEGVDSPRQARCDGSLPRRRRALMHRLAVGREDFCQRLLTTLILGGSYPDGTPLDTHAGGLRIPPRARHDELRACHATPPDAFIDAVRATAPHRCRKGRRARLRSALVRAAVDYPARRPSAEATGRARSRRTSTSAIITSRYASSTSPTSLRGCPNWSRRPTPRGALRPRDVGKHSSRDSP